MYLQIGMMLFLIQWIMSTFAFINAFPPIPSHVHQRHDAIFLYIDRIKFDKNQDQYIKYVGTTSGIKCNFTCIYLNDIYALELMQ